MNKWLLIGLLTMIFDISGLTQRTLSRIDYGADFTLRISKRFEDAENGTNFFSQNSTFKITPFVAKKIKKNWEISGRGIFIWYRKKQEIINPVESEKTKKDQFSLGIGPALRRYFTFKNQPIRIFIDADLKGFGLIGKRENSGLFGKVEISRMGVGLFGGVGVLFQINDRLALESMVDVNIVRLNTFNMWAKGTQFHLGFRLLNPFFGED